jgi:hypothetical protein
MTGTPAVPGAITVTALTGSELVPIATVGPMVAQTTTGDIAALAVTDTPFVSTNITTAGNGTLTSASLIGDVIVRSGPSAAFTDATDTAANIIAAFPSAAPVGAANEVLIKNSTAYPMTLSAGLNVTLPATFIIPPFSTGWYAVQIASATAVTILHLGTSSIATGSNITSPASTALNTVGNGTILAASGFTSGITTRGGTQTAAFSDTTDTAAAIIAGCVQLVGKIGTSFVYYYVNATTWPATIGGGNGVTVSGITVVPAGMTVGYLITYTAAATLTMVGIGVTQNASGAYALAGSTSGEITVQAAAIAGQNTITLPAVTGTAAMTSGADLWIGDISRCTTELDKTTDTTLANVVGLVQTVAVGTYYFEIDLTGTAGASGGWKVAFNYTTAVLSALNATGYAFTAAAVAVQATTTTTTQTSLISDTAAVIGARIVGTMIVTTGGTVQLQFAQNASNGTASSIYVGSTMKFIRIA